MREWLEKLDEIDQDCVYQYEYLLGRELKNYEEYHEIDGKVMEMILEFETREDFFEYYPEVMKQYANPKALESLQETNEVNVQQNETIRLWARLGVSLDVTPKEFAVLNGSNGKAAQDLLVALVQSDRCHMDGDTYFPENASDIPFEELSFDLPFRSLHPAEEQESKLYTIAMANNVDYEVEVVGPFFSREETQEELRRLYMETWENVGEDRIVEADCNFDTLTFKIEAYGSELYYANVKELELDRSERGRTSARDHSAELGVEQPESLDDRIASAKEKSNQSPLDASATPEKHQDR